MQKEYKTITEVVGPIMVVEGVEGVKYDELVHIKQADGSIRVGKVLEIDGDRAMVQLFESSQGLRVAESKAKFLGHGTTLSVSRDMLGRVFDGMGRSIDNGPEIIPEKKLDINGSPLNPAARKEVPGRRGYPGYLYTDLASMYERAGRINGNAGSITQIPILTMPEDDKTHPIPDLTGYITEGQIILSRELYYNGVTPPIDVLPSLSRLKDKGIGKGKTREDHADTMNQLFSAYARGKDAKELAVILGESALSEMDKLYAKFAVEFEKRYVSQGYETDRSIEETLNIGWELLGILPRTELKRIRTEYLDKYYHEAK